MYNDLSVADIRQLFSNCLVMFNNHLVFVSEVKPTGACVVKHVSSGLLEEVEHRDITFKSVDKHIGMVNYEGGCAFVSRKPVRLYHIGLHMDNTNICSSDARSPIRVLADPGVKDAYDGNYPSLEQAYSKAVKENVWVAFDKSFCVSSIGTVHYRELINVGYVKDGNTIVFNEGHGYLKHRIGESYGKDYQPVRSA